MLKQKHEAEAKHPNRKKERKTARGQLIKFLKRAEKLGMLNISFPCNFGSLLHHQH